MTSGTNVIQQWRTLAGGTWAALRRGTGPLTLRRKLLAAFLALAAMAGLCGFAGLVFFQRIAGSVSVLSEVTSPLLIESMALIDNADRMRWSFLDGANPPGGDQEQLAALAKLDKQGRQHIAKLNRLSALAGTEERFAPAEQLQSDYVATLQEIIQARTDRKKAASAVLVSYREVIAGAARADMLLLDVGRQFENSIAAGEEAAREHARSGTATARVLRNLLSGMTAQSFPGLQVAYKLTWATAQSRELAESVLSIQGELDLDRLEAEAQRIFRTAATLRQQLSARLRTPQQEADLADLNASFEALQTAFLGLQGLIAKKREALRAMSRLTARSKKLSEIETRYSDVLHGFASAVHARNDVSKAQTADTIEDGRTLIILAVALTGFLALAAALFITRSIAAPLDRLTRHVRSIRKRGDLTGLADPGPTSSSDEIGQLARAFNGMIGELASARRELIAKSEAEISKQVERLEAALTNMSQGLCMFDRDQRLIVSNMQYAEIYGIAPGRIRPGMTLRDILAERVAAGGYYGEAAAHVESRIAANREAKPSDTIVELKNGRAIHIVRRPMKNGGWVATHEDVTERRRIEAKIAHMARHDALTGLPNRLLFREKMQEALARVGRGEKIAVFCLDLDQFRSVNDTLGHPIGDALLWAVTQRLLQCVRGQDTISRLGGDEFAIIRSMEDAPVEATALAERIIRRLGEPYELDAHQAVIGVSVGIAVAPGGGTTPDELLKNADLALTRAKADGRGTYRFFEPEMDVFMQARRKLELDLRKALGAGEFELYYQPLINLERHAIIGFESLLRWRHPERGLVPPSEFIPMMEEVGLIVPVGEWVLGEACRQAAAWPSTIRVAVNLSPVQVKSPDLVQAVERALAAAGLPPDRLELEITESVLLEENPATLAALHELKKRGVRISMDDFGTGYCSLSYLRRFPFDKIKIDQSFVRDFPHCEDSLAIVRAVTTLGQSLGMTTTAEGVEREDQLERLKAEGCTEVQGYFFSPPRPESEIAGLIAKAMRRRRRGVAAAVRWQRTA